jgi:hypothetical protein
MIKGACHCAAVRFELAEAPSWVLDCNCTICRRYAALWAYLYRPDQPKLVRVPDPEATETYLWNERSIAFHRCKVCGCVTHLEAVEVAPKVVLGVNARMIPTLDPARVRVRQVDNSHTGVFWTRSDEAVIASRHPKMLRPGPDDWR